MKTLWIFKEHVTRSQAHRSQGLVPGEHVYMTYTELANVTWSAAAGVAEAQVVAFIKQRMKRDEIGNVCLKADIEVVSIPQDDQTTWLGGYSHGM